MNRDRRRKKSEEPESSGAPAWMATFSDMMTLLLTFFILLYSISTVDVQKFRDISTSLQAVLAGQGQPLVFEGGEPDPELPIIDNKDPIDEEDPQEIEESAMEMYWLVRDYVEEQGLEAEVRVNLTRTGVFVDIKEVILFEPGRVELKPRGREVLDELEGLFLAFENRIIVEGHTDNVPTNPDDHPTNWELSTERAVVVVRYLSEIKAVPEQRLAAMGYGEHQPVASNDTPVNRALNRRVNLLIIVEEGDL